MHVKRYQNYLEILFCMATSLFGSFPKTSKIPFYTLENPPAGRQQQILKYKELLINLTALEGHKSTVTVALQSLNKQSQKKLGYFFSRPSTDIKETSTHYLYESVRMAPLLLWYHGTDCAQSSSGQ